MSDLIDRQALRRAMYHEAMEKDSKDQRWDSGCWIRYRMFERVVDSMPAVQSDNDAISRQAVIDLLKNWAGGYDYIETETAAAIKEVQQLPAVDCYHFYFWRED